MNLAFLFSIRNPPCFQSTYSTDSFPIPTFIASKFIASYSKVIAASLGAEQSTFQPPVSKALSSMNDLMIPPSFSFRLCSTNESPLPETAPSNVMLAQVLQLGSLDDQLVNLIGYVELLVRLEVATSELLLHAIQDLKSTGVLNFLLLLLVVAMAINHAAASRVDRRRVGAGTGASGVSGHSHSMTICARGSLRCEKLGGRHGSVKDRRPAGARARTSGHGDLPLGGEVGTRRAGGIGQTPIEQRIMNELVRMLVNDFNEKGT